MCPSRWSTIIGAMPRRLLLRRRTAVVPAVLLGCAVVLPGCVATTPAPQVVPVILSEAESVEGLTGAIPVPAPAPAPAGSGQVDDGHADG